MPVSPSATGIGIGLSETDSPTLINDFLFSDSGFTPTSISYTGSLDSLALLENGHSISEIGGAEVVGIDRGIFLSSGGGPGTENTSGSFTVNLGEPGDAVLEEVVQAAFTGAGSTRDASVVTFTFDSADLGNAPSIQFELFFGSDEYPEFVNSSFVDIAGVIVNGVNYALFNNDSTQPLSIVGESINTEGNFFNNTTGEASYSTEYDGFSVLLNVVAPIQQGENTVTIGIADTGDSAYDSGLFIGNVQASNLNAGGSFVQTNGSSGDDMIDANAAPQLINLGGGADTVAGTAQEFNGDLIEGFGDDDELQFEGSEFGADDVTITMGSAILAIDSDGDGTADTNLTLQGNFSEASFEFVNEGGNTSVSATGVMVDGELINGTAGNETLTGTAGNDTINGLDGNDGVFGGSGDDLLDGGDGNDQLAGSDGNDTVLGGNGDDNMGGGLGDDSIDGGAGSDTIGAGEGNDVVNGGDGDDFVYGGAGNDTMSGGEGNDDMGGSFGHDIINGDAGNDNIGGGVGRDTIDGGTGNDTIGAGEGDDVVNGGDGDDVVNGGGRNDMLDGGAGDDRVNGGTGDDTMTGGEGADLFIFNSFNSGDADVITDFEVGVDQFRMTGVQGAVGAGIEGKFAALNATNTADGAMLSYDGNTILLEGVNAAELSVDDFVFI